MKRTTERRRKRARLGLTASPTLLIVALSAIVQLQQATYVQAADQQSAQQARRFELKFQNDLDNSTVIKRPAQQQVFKCQVRLAPIASSPTAASQHRLNFTSSSLTNQEANHRYSQWLAQVDSLQANSMQLDKLLMQSAPEVQLPLNVTRLTIDWLKDGRPLWEAYDGEPLATVNVTLKTRGSDKTTTAARQPKLRLEIKNTLNGQQLKLTSRLRVAQLKASDSGQFKCIARAQFMILGSTSVELVEQSLEASGANLVMLPIGSDSNSNATTIRKHQNDAAPAPAAISRVVDANAKTTPTLGQRAPAPQTSSRGYDNEVRHGAESGLYSADHNGNQEDKQSQLAGSHNAAIPSQTSSPFEDDEDLYRLDSLAAHEQLINGQPRGQHQVGTSETLPANDEDNQPLEPQWPPFESAANENGNVNGLLAVRRQSQQQQHHHHHHHHQQEAYLDWILNADGEDLAPADRESTVQQPPVRSQQQGDNGEAEAAPLSAEQQRRLSGATDSQTSPRYRKIDDLAGSSSELVSGAPHQSGRRRLVASPQPETPTSTRSQLAKLVHQIVVPESSCYTGLGELYHGNASQSADQRPCLNWHQVRRALVSWSQRLAAHQNQSSSLLDGTSSVSRAAFARSIAKGTNADENHNYCRNPNGDLRGPWCFVAYSEELDGGLVQRVDSPAWHKVLTHKQQTVRVGRVLRQHDQEQQLLVVARKCQLASCAEYLWLYVVAPPLGLLVLLVCLVSLMIRSIRKSHYNAIFTAAYQRHSEPAGSGKVPGGTLLASGLRKLMSRNGTARLVCTKSSGGLWKFLACGHSRGVSSSMAVSHSCKRKKTAATKTASAKRANYLGDEDIFEIVDDIDWSDGQAAAALSSSPNSMSSPKSSESFRLQHSAGSFTNSTTCEGSTSSSLSPLNCSQVTHGNLNWPQKSTLSHSKSINPMFGERSALADLHLSQQHSSQQQKQQSTGTASKMSKSKSQAGPMFATLRCHVRNAHQQQQRRLIEAANSNSNSNNSNNSNSNNNNNNNNRCQQAKNSSSIKEQQGGRDDRQDRSQVTGHLISCSSSSSSGSILTMQQSNPSASVAKVDELEKSTTTWLASQLPRLDASSVTVAYEAQPIYEGKFSQVSMAYMRQHKDDLAQATGQIGAQVAVCSLKQQAALDENVFYASNLRLRNLNHLNLVKLLGHVEFDSDDHQQEQHYYDNITAPRAANRSKSKVCSLVYDMAHLIDLSDWLKEQSKDAVVARQEEISGDLSLRQNLSCIAKQIALAVDYLHDRNVVFKDLACRNCFLDVTRMLVKLASFNVELEFEANEANEEVVYSVPSSSQTTSATQDDLNSKKLSIKSMVRPKYLFDYYVIDSRPAECQLLPLSWIPLESILFNKFNKQTDIWSFGCLLYELFSLGEVAYFGYSSKQVIDSVRSNLMPPQPLLCPNGIYKLMCKCLSDIPTLRPNIKHTYEQLNLYTGQCSSFLNHHLCII